MSSSRRRSILFLAIFALLLCSLASVFAAARRSNVLAWIEDRFAGDRPGGSSSPCREIEGGRPCVEGAASPYRLPESGAPVLALSGVSFDAIESNVGIITGMDLAPDGRLFYSVQDGAVFIKRMEGGSVGAAQPSAPFLENLSVARSGFEDGLLGLALSPDFDRDRQVYLYYSVPNEDGLPVEGRIVRFTEQDGTATDEAVIVGGLPARPDQLYHFGGGLAFGSDNKLYLVFGETNLPAEAQNPASLEGSILRYNRDGSIPDDNPSAGSPVYAYGIRNGFGLAWHPETGALYASENGESCDDELNRIVAGGNYGWGVYAYDTCPYPDDGGLPPLLEWTPPIAPTALAFYTSDRIPELSGKLLLCGFMDKLLYAIDLDPATSRVSAVWAVEVGGRRDLCQSALALAPDGSIFTAADSGLWRIGP